MDSYLELDSVKCIFN